MRSFDHWLRRRIAGWLVGVLILVLVVPFGELGTAQTVSGAQAPDASAQNQLQDPGSTNSASIPDSPAPAASAQQAAPQQQNGNEPLGTAAAPYEKPLGAAVSRPVGAAIAPGKQRRRRSFLIKVGLIVAGAAAVGTVVALSKGSPSTPATH